MLNKEEKNIYLTRLNKAKTVRDLFSIAGNLNNYSEHIQQDKVTIMGFMSFEAAHRHTLRMLNTIQEV